MGESSRETIRLKEQTEKSFGFEWNKFNAVFPEYEANFLSYIDPIDAKFLFSKLVLDAGCGAGRHAYFAGKYGAEVIAIDASDRAVLMAMENTKSQLRVKVAKVDIYDLPENWKGMFGYVMAIGVLHHLPDPQDGFNRLVSMLEPGGSISIWVYSGEDNKLATRLYEPARKITTRIPHWLLYWLALPLAVTMEIVNRLRLPVFRHYRRFPFRTKWNDAFDVFSAPSAKYYTLEDIQGWYEQAGLKDVRVSYRMLDGVAKGIKGLGVKVC